MIYLENAHNFLSQERAWIRCLRQSYPSVVCEDDYPIDLGFLRLNQLLQSQVDGSYVVNKRIVVWFPFS